MQGSFSENDVICVTEQSHYLIEFVLHIKLWYIRQFSSTVIEKLLIIHILHKILFLEKCTRKKSYNNKYFTEKYCFWKNAQRKNHLMIDIL